jgi:hypothetical protein
MVSIVSTPTSPRRPINGVLWLGTQALGLGLVLFSAPAVFAPRFFGRLAGLPITDDPASNVAIRSVAVRDVVMGIGLISAARHHARLKPWLLIRTLCDGGDSVAIALAFLSGAGDRPVAVPCREGRGELGRHRRARDRGLLRVARLPVGLLERLVDRLEGEGVRDHLVPRDARARALHEVDRAG